MSDCEYHEQTAEQTLAAIVDALDGYALLDVLEAQIGVDEDDMAAWFILVSAMCRAREIVAAQSETTQKAEEK